MEQLKARSHRRLILWGVAVLVVIAGAALAVMRTADGKGTAKPAAKSAAKPGSGKDKKPETTAAPVELSTATRGTIHTWLQTTATLEARNSATLVAKRQGQIQSIAAEEGAWVEKGAVLAQLDDTDARLAVERAEVALDVAKREADRGQKMVDEGYMSAKEWDDVELKMRDARVELDQRRYDLSQTRITAPFAGRVSERLVNLGETVTPGRECFRLVDFDPVRARLYFPERELGNVRVGQLAELTTDGRPGKAYDAHVALVNPVVDHANGTFKVTIEAGNAGGALRPGGFVRVRLKTGSFDDALLCPRRGLLTEDGDHYVFVARADSVVRANVVVGAVEGEQAQILSGLVAGDRVVTVGQGGLKSGARIKVSTF